LTTTRPSRSAWTRRFAAAAALIVVTLPWTIGAARRNVAYLRLLHGDPSGAGYAGDDLFVLRSSLSHGDWTTAERMLAKTSRPDRLAALLVLNEAGRRVDVKDIGGARAALAIVSAQAGSDRALWYRLAEIYDRAGAPRDAVSAYARGAAVDPAAPWTEGRYRIAMIYHREKNWQALADSLAPVLTTATDQDTARSVDSFRTGGGLWQEAFLILGEAYRHLGRPAEEEALYERVSRIAAPRRDWTLNRALVYLSAAKRTHGDFTTALESVRRALDLSTEFDDSHRREYELDTALEANRLIDQARRDGRLGAVRASLDEMVQRVGEKSPGAWFLRGLASEAACDLARARSDYGRAAALVTPGSGAFLAGRPAEPPRSGCPSR
jgi:tetratricopeptide (TPR) repeat protein